LLVAHYHLALEEFQEAELFACYSVDAKRKYNDRKSFDEELAAMKIFFLFGTMIIGMLVFVFPVSAQTRPFLYTVTLPAPEQTAVLHFDAGWGNGSLGFSEGPAIDRRLGILWNLKSRWTVRANAGFGDPSNDSTTFSGQAEVFYSFRNRSSKSFQLNLGGGMRWEREDGEVALFQVITGWQEPSWQLSGNVILEKPQAEDRDALDLIMSLGWSHRVTSSMGFGLEAVGQDLEGFWEANEAEGGARILVGPSANFFKGSWEAAVCSGYVFRPTNSGRVSGADRPFGSNRWAVQVSFAHTL
jgi:hypothetical protein